ncbi:MAG: hypothetical protein O3A01_02650 [bacterium]|nr:hypothetical protein [bacterium]
MSIETLAWQRKRYFMANFQVSRETRCLFVDMACLEMFPVKPYVMPTYASFLAVLISGRVTMFPVKH